MLPAIIYLISGNYYFFPILFTLIYLKRKLFYLTIFFIGLLQAFYFNQPLEKFKFLNNKVVAVYGKVNSISQKKFLLNCSKIFYHKKVLKFKEKILIYVKRPIVLKKGDTISAKVKIKIPKNYDIPGSFNYVNYLKGKGIKFVGFLIPKTEVKIISENKGFFAKYINFLTELIDSQKCNKFIKSLEKSLITGDKSYLNKNEKNFLIKNGISHLFVISGLHITTIFIFFLYLTRLILIKFNNFFIPYIIGLIFTLFYVIFTGINYPAVRAFLILTIFISLIFLKRYRDPFEILFFILFFIVIIKPFAYLNLSLQFSFVVVFFLILFFRNFQMNKFNAVISATILCFFAGLPLTTYYFSAIYVKGLCANIIAVPFFSIFIIPISALFVFLPLKFLLKILSINFKIFLKIIGFIPDIKPLFLFKLSGFEVVLWYFILVIFLFTIKFFDYKKLALGFILFSLAIIIHFKIHNFKNRYAIIKLRRTRALFINFKNKNVLIDGGKNSIILNFLLYKGIRKLDYLVLTKYNKIFLESSQFLIANFKIKNLWYPSKFEGELPEFLKIKGKNIFINSKKVNFSKCKLQYCENNL